MPYRILSLRRYPPKVSINEYIDVAKGFQHKNSGKFVNGVLDAILDKMAKRKTDH